MQHATAADVVKVVTALMQAGRGGEGGNAPPVVVADERSNSVMVAGPPSDRLQVADLVHRLDTDLPGQGSTQVIYLRYASAENLAAVIEGYAQKLSQAKRPEGATATASSSEGEARVIADKDTKVVVVENKR